MSCSLPVKRLAYQGHDPLKYLLKSPNTNSPNTIPTPNTIAELHIGEHETPIPTITTYNHAIQSGSLALKFLGSVALATRSNTL